MSIQAIAWAIEQSAVTDATAQLVLMCLANYADHDGCAAFPSVERLCRDTRLSPRTVRAKLGLLEKGGQIRRGNQKIVAAYIDRADRRPICYDIVMTKSERVHAERGAGAARRTGERGANDDTNGVQMTTERGAGAAPNPSYNHQEIHGGISADAESVDSTPEVDDERTTPEIIQDVYNELLGSRPGCIACRAMNPKFVRRLQQVDKDAKKACAENEIEYEPEEFWRLYFTECLKDPWMRGDRPNPRNARWKQSLKTLVDDERFLQIANVLLAAAEGEQQG
ncbi:helix-turn-helix domain-containing protein [Stenotrophomonas sp. LARHCG68]